MHLLYIKHLYEAQAQKLQVQVNLVLLQHEMKRNTQTNSSDPFSMQTHESPTGQWRQPYD